MKSERAKGMVAGFGRGLVVAVAGILMIWVSGCACCEKLAGGGEEANGEEANGEKSLFDGQTLKGWGVTDFAGHGEVEVVTNTMILRQGVMTGVTWTNAIARMNYELSLEAMRVDGSDFFCGLTFPVGEDPCSLIVGGWGGGVVGLSSIDGEDAANNETTQYMNFEAGRWYQVRVRVEPGRIRAWIDEEEVVNVETTGRKISIRIEMEMSQPLGVATWATTGALRNFRIRELGD